MSKPYEQRHPESLPNRGQVQADLAPQLDPQAAQSMPTESGTMPRRRMIGGGSKLGVDCSKLIARGYHPYWRNDMDGRVQEALANGYEFVSPDEIEEVSLRISAEEMSKEKVSRIVGYTDRGDPIRAFLMKIKKEWHEENMAFYKKRNDAIDVAIRSGNVASVESGYSPKEGTSYQHRSR
jgi:hypothetical protein